MKANCTTSCFRSKRFIFINSTKSYVGEKNETDWHLDPSGHQCDNLDGTRVEATVTLTDYLKDESGLWSFDFMEFSGDWYRVQRLSLNADKSVAGIKLIERNSIASIFNCQQSRDLPPEPTGLPADSTTSGTNSETTEDITKMTRLPRLPQQTRKRGGPTKPQTEDTSVLWIILWISLIILLITALMAAACFVLYRKGNEQQDRDEPPIPMQPVGRQAEVSSQSPSVQQPVTRPESVDDLRVKSTRSGLD